MTVPKDSMKRNRNGKNKVFRFSFKYLHGKVNCNNPEINKIRFASIITNLVFWLSWISMICKYEYLLLI